LFEESQKSVEQKEEFKQKMQETYWSRDPAEITKHHTAQSTGVKKWHEQKDPQIEHRRRVNMMDTKRRLSLKYIHHPTEQMRKQVPESQVSSYIEQGWRIGMGPRSKRS